MKHLRRYNESDETKTFKNNDEDIKMFFTDYIDADPDSFKIKNGLVYDGDFIDDTSYMKNPSKYRRAKLVTINVCEADGISTPGIGATLTNIETLQNLLDDIKRFYALSGEEINYSINTNYRGLEVQFVTLGDVPKSEESQASKIDGYLQRVKEWIKKRGHKKQTISGNWLDMRFVKKGAPPMGYDYYVNDKLRKVGDGTLNLENSTGESDIEIITIRNEAWEDGLKFITS